MVVRWGIVTKRQGLTRDEFAHEWLSVHVPMVQNMATLRSYRQNIVVDAEQRSPFPRSAVTADGFAQLEFDSLNAMRESMAGLQANPALDLGHFLESVRTVATVRKVDRHPPVVRDASTLVKRVSLLRRAPGVTRTQFQDEWWGEHSRLVAEMPGYVGYAQNLVVEELGEPELTSDPDLGLDGIVEFWFENKEAMRRCYESEEFARTARHGRDFIGKITTFLVEEHVSVTGGASDGHHK